MNKIKLILASTIMFLSCSKKEKIDYCKYDTKDIIVTVQSQEETSYKMEVNSRNFTRHKYNKTNGNISIDTFPQVSITNCVDKGNFNIHLYPVNESLDSSLFDAYPISAYFKDTLGYIHINMYLNKK